MFRDTVSKNTTVCAYKFVIVIKWRYLVKFCLYVANAQTWLWTGLGASRVKVNVTKN